MELLLENKTIVTKEKKGRGGIFVTVKEDFSK